MSHVRKEFTEMNGWSRETLQSIHDMFVRSKKNYDWAVERRSFYENSDMQDDMKKITINGLDGIISNQSRIWHITLSTYASMLGLKKPSAYLSLSNPVPILPGDVIKPDYLGSDKSSSARAQFQDNVHDSDNDVNNKKESQLSIKDIPLNVRSKNRVNLADRLEEAKQAVQDQLDRYISPWKLSIFGHHHNARAKYIKHRAGKSKSFAKLTNLIETQLQLMQGQAVHGQAFWHRRPGHIPADLNKSGYYRALTDAFQVIQAINAADRSIDEQTVGTNLR